MKRRLFLTGALAFALGFARPESLPIRKAVFEEVDNSVLLGLSVPGLFRSYDRDALFSIDSGFTTTLAFRIRLYRSGSNRLLQTTRLSVEIKWDPWRRRYVVTHRDRNGTARRYFATRQKAIADAVSLDRVRIIAANRLLRGSAYYYATVFAQRNPLKSRAARGSKRAGTGRGQGRDLEWFGRLVESLAGERATAEETVHIRTNPFYLVKR